jgi:AraC-like DNA-binding protein
MASVTVLLKDPARRRQVTRAARKVSPEPSLFFASDWADLRRRCHESPPSLAIFNPYLSGDESLRLCSTVTSEAPLTTPIAYADFARRPPRDLIRFAEAGVRDVIGDRRGAELRDLVALLRHPPSPPLATMVTATMEEHAQPLAQGILECVVADAAKGLTPAMLAKRLHVSRDTVARQLRMANLPSPNRLIVWGRILTGGWLLARYRWTVERAAAYLRYSSPGTFRNQLRQCAGTSARALRAEGGLGRMMEAFRTAVHRRSSPGLS